MSRRIEMRMISLLAALMLMSVTFIPAVSAAVVPVGEQANGDNKFFFDAGKVVSFDSPRNIVLENTNTSSIVVVGDVRITLTSNPDHSAATMIIRTTTTGEKHKVDYKTTFNSGIYSTEVSYDGKPGSTYTTDYDPFEPGNTRAVLERSNKKKGIVSF